MTETYKITLKNCSFYAFHGVFAQEKQDGQRFYIDAELTVKLPSSLLEDKLENVINYGLVFDEIQACVKDRCFDLIEALAAFIGKQLCDKFPTILSAVIKVRKPDAPIVGDFDYVEVCVETTKS